MTGQAQDWTGQQMARAPSFSGNLGANYKVPLAGGSLNLSANGSYTASFVISNPSLFGPLGPPGLANKQRYRQGSYALVNAQIGWTDPSDQFTVTVYGDNLTDKNIASSPRAVRSATIISTANRSPTACASATSLTNSLDRQGAARPAPCRWSNRNDPPGFMHARARRMAKHR